MPLQTVINLDQAVAVTGDRASLNNIIYHTTNPLAEAAITVGTFVWGNTADEGLANYGGTGAPLGFVERWLAYGSWFDNQTEDGTLVIDEGKVLQVARKGDFWAVSKTVATIGQKVFASTTDGTISTAAAGGSVSGAVETEWVVKTPGAAGDLIIISSWE